MEYIEEENKAFKKYKEIVGKEFERWLNADKKNVIRFMTSICIAKHKGCLSFQDYRMLKEILED